MRPVRRWLPLLALALALAPAVEAAPANAATIRVSSLGDGGGCTLRAAIAAVDAPGARTPCAAAGRGANTIVLPAGTVDLTQEAPLVVGASVDGLRIAGAGEANTAVSGIGQTRVFEIQAGAIVLLEDLTVLDGQAPVDAATATATVAADGGSGGGILNAGVLTADDLAITGSHGGVGGLGGNGATGGAGGSGGAIENTGQLTLSGVTLSGDGAGIGGDGGAPVSTAAGQVYAPGGAGGTGGAIDNAGGVVSVSVSLFDADAAGTGGAGGVGYAVPTATTPGSDGGDGGDGGAIATHGGAVTLTNSTFTANDAGVPGLGGLDAQNGGSGAGGAISADGTAAVTLINDTIAGNTAPGAGGGVAAPAPLPAAGPLAGVVAEHTLFAANTGGNCADPALRDAGYNLSYGDATCPVSFLHGNPELGPLKLNGGPTDTIALGRGSAAQWAIPAGCPATDGRGILRTGACDIGAWQGRAPTVALGSVGSVTATTARLVATVDINGGGGLVTVRYGARARSVGVAPGTAAAPLAVVLTGLAPGQRYRYRFLVSTPDGHAESAVGTFATRGSPRPATPAGRRGPAKPVRGRPGTLTVTARTGG